MLPAIEQNKDLAAYNTFGIHARAPFFAEVNTIPELQAILGEPEYQQMPLLILGGGSNVLFTRNPEGLVILNKIGGIEKLKEDDAHVWVKVGGGVVWHEFVLYCIAQGWAGLENLSLIPGTAGAAPMQNIGAYGVEIKDTFEELQAVSRKDGSLRTFSHAECEFDYRSSIFKTSARDQYVIADVTFRLNKKPVLNTSYGAIKETLEQQGVHPERLTIKAVSDAVIHIRQSKLPDPKLIGNAGSFFKNPVISAEAFEEFKKNHPDAPHYLQPDGTVKVPAGWLIQQAGWKGYRRGAVGVHSKQALVLVNHGGGKGEELLQLARDIQQDVEKKFGIRIEPEVNVI